MRQAAESPGKTVQADARQNARSPPPHACLAPKCVPSVLPDARNHYTITPVYVARGLLARARTLPSSPLPTPARRLRRCRPLPASTRRTHRAKWATHRPPRNWTHRAAPVRPRTGKQGRGKEQGVGGLGVSRLLVSKLGGVYRSGVGAGGES